MRVRAKPRVIKHREASPVPSPQPLSRRERGLKARARIVTDPCPADVRMRALSHPPSRYADEQLVPRPGPQDLLHPALVRRLFRRRWQRACRGAPHRRAGPGRVVAGNRRFGPRRRCQAAVAGAFPGHPRPAPGQVAGRLRAGAAGLGLCRRLYRRVSDQGQPASGCGRHAGQPPWRRLRAGSRLQAGADGGTGAEPPGRADRLQRLQGPRIHPAGADRPQARLADLHRHREALRAEAGAGGSQGAGREARHRRAHAAGLAGRRQMAEQRRRQGQVRALPAAGAGPVEDPATASTPTA